MSKKYILDSNICIALFRGNIDVRNKLNAIGKENCFILDLTKYEILVGAEIKHLKHNDNELQKVKAFLGIINIMPSAPYYEYAAKEKAYLYNIGKPNEDFIDLVIGCASVVENMVLITENVKHFENIRSINIENWINRQKAN